MSLALRLSAAFVGLVAVTSLALGAAGFVSAQRGVTAQIDRFLESRAEAILDGQRVRPSRPDRDGSADRGDTGNGGGRNDGRDRNDGRAGTMGDAARAIADTVDADSVVQLLDGDGAIVVTTGIELPVSDTDRQLAGSGTDTTTLRTVQTESGSYRMITAADRTGGAVQVARGLAESTTAIDLVQSRLAVAIPLLALLAGGAGLLLAQRITRPIRTLATSVDTIAETGDLTVPIDTSGTDEVGRLAAGFDRLLRSLAHSRAQQQRLVQDAAHELRTPMTSVKANLDLLAAAPDLDDESRSQILASLRSEMNELNQLVAEIVDVASDRHRQPSTRPVDLALVAGQAADRFELRAGPERALHRDLQTAVINGDPESLGRAVDNLLANAERHTPAGTPVTITVATEANHAVLTVADRGDGIPVTERELVFERFHRTTEARGRPGSGLGLSIVKAIVEANDGEVGIDAGPGGGAAVWIRLPLSRS